VIGSFISFFHLLYVKNLKVFRENYAPVANAQAVLIPTFQSFYIWAIRETDKIQAFTQTTGMENVLLYYRGLTLNGLVGCDTIFQTGLKPDINKIILDL